MNAFLIEENLMSHSLYAASVPVFRQLLDALAGVLADVFARSDADIAEMGRKARVHCATHFNRTRYIEGIETVYRELGVKF